MVSLTVELSRPVTPLAIPCAFRVDCHIARMLNGGILGYSGSPWTIATIAAFVAAVTASRLLRLAFSASASFHFSRQTSLTDSRWFILILKALASSLIGGLLGFRLLIREDEVPSLRIENPVGSLKSVQHPG